MGVRWEISFFVSQGGKERERRTKGSEKEEGEGGKKEESFYSYYRSLLRKVKKMQVRNVLC